MGGECEVGKGFTDYCEVEENEKTNRGRDELGCYASQNSSKCGIAHYLFMHN